MDQTIPYLIDLVLCIDCTGSMSPVLDDVKAAALSLHTAIEKKLNEKKKKSAGMRIRVVAFRDFFDKDEPAIEEMSEFAALPSEVSKFENFVRNLRAAGGGDEPESGLEALALALNSSFTPQVQNKTRSVIVLWTDASVHDLERAKRDKPVWPYPKAMPASFDELTERWEALPNASKRLVVYAPDCKPWSQIADCWKNAFLFPSQAGKGLEEFEFDEILSNIANSI